MPTEKPMTTQKVAELVIGQIRMDIGLWEFHHGEGPGKIFMSRALYDLIRSYHIRLINYDPNPRNVKIFGIPVEAYIPEEPDTLEYHLANGGKQFNWTGVQNRGSGEI